MNWVLIVVLSVLALCAWMGYRKGLLRMVYSLVSWILILVFVSWASPQIETYLVENTTIYERLKEHFGESIKVSASTQMELGIENSENELTQLGVNVPESVLEGLVETTADMASAFLVQSGVYEQIAEEMAGFVMQGLAFVITVITARILLHIISQLLGIVSHIPVIKGINRTLGLFAGAVYGIFIIWIAFYIVALCGTSETGALIVSYIYESPFLTQLYENNLILILVLRFF